MGFPLAVSRPAAPGPGCPRRLFASLYHPGIAKEEIQSAEYRHPSLAVKPGGTGPFSMWGCLLHFGTVFLAGLNPSCTLVVEDYLHLFTTQLNPVG